MIPVVITHCSNFTLCSRDCIEIPQTNQKSKMFTACYHALFTVLFSWQVVFTPPAVKAAYISEITCPQLCQCLDKDVGCNNLNLTRLPNDIDVSTEKLELAENKLSAESLGLKLQFYTNLKTLDLRDNFITVITKELLQGLESTLVSLDLSGNGIRRVEKNTLSSLKSLRYLKLSRNDLNGIPELPENLEMLDLSENVKISSLKVTSLLGLRKLRHLIINDCSIYTIEENCFSEQQVLSDLQLNGNSLYQIPLNLPPTLTSISLQDNRIRTIGAEGGFRDPFTNLTRLENLFLQRNWINEISGGAFKSLSSLRELDLSINRLEVIPSKLPKGLMRLNLGGNLLTHISSDSGYISTNNNPFSEMDFLERLALNNNSLSSLPSKLLQKNYWLTSLDLSDNEFDTIPNIYTEAKLELNLDGNKIQDIQLDSFSNCPRIVKLYLNNNQISRIARAGLSTLKDLRTLEIRGNSLIDLPLFENQRLTNIDLSFNIIQTVTPATFNLTKLLTKLNLENNELSVLEESVFENLKNLKYLFLANNKIIEINFFIPPSVMELQLHHNQIATIGNLTSSYFSTDSFLTALDLSSNNIRSISKFAFSQFRFLTDIYLESNKISSLKLDFPSSAKRISLAKNVIKKLESSAITGLTHAYFVDFSGNRISLIEKDFFSNEEFQLRSDQNVNRLFEVNLENNYLQTINRKVLSPILDNQIQLSLAISGNPIRCNCLWKWLSDELSQPYLEISGDCYHPMALRKQEISHIAKEKFECMAPRIRSVARNMKLVTTIGATATLECIADGEPVPIYTWAIHSSNGNDLITLINDEVYVSYSCHK